MDTGQFDRLRVISPKAPRAALNCGVEIEDQAVASSSVSRYAAGKKTLRLHQPVIDTILNLNFEMVLN